MDTVFVTLPPTINQKQFVKHLFSQEPTVVYIVIYNICDYYKIHKGHSYIQPSIQ